MDQHQPQELRLDEAALRRPDFAGGEAIELADGRPWHFPTVVARVGAEVLHGEATPVIRWHVAGSPFEPGLAAALDAAFRRPDGREPDLMPAQHYIDLATVLLRRNYRLTEAECDWLVFEGFWTRARRDGRLIVRSCQVHEAIIRVGMTGPLDSFERAERALPRYAGGIYDVGSN